MPLFSHSYPNCDELLHAQTTPTNATTDATTNATTDVPNATADDATDATSCS